MARNSSIRHRVRRNKGEMTEVDITSLLDILTILLVFLVINYNATGFEMTIPEGIKLPTSTSKTTNHPGIQVQVSPNKIWVEGEEVLDSDNMPSNAFDQGGKRIIPLFNKLVEVKEKIQNIDTQINQEQSFSGTLNLVVDKSLKYSYIKKLMYTSAEAGFVKFQLVVMGEEN